MQVELDKTRELKFDLAAIKDLEAALNGAPLGSIFGQLAQMSITALTTALWAGLKAQDRTLTPSLVTKYVQTYLDNGGKVKTLMDAVADALKASGLFNEDESEGNEKPELVRT